MTRANPSVRHFQRHRRGSFVRAARKREMSRKAQTVIRTEAATLTRMDKALEKMRAAEAGKRAACSSAKEEPIFFTRFRDARGRFVACKGFAPPACNPGRRPERRGIAQRLAELARRMKEANAEAGKFYDLAHEIFAAHFEPRHEWDEPAHRGEWLEFTDLAKEANDKAERYEREIERIRQLAGNPASKATGRRRGARFNPASCPMRTRCYGANPKDPAAADQLLLAAQHALNFLEAVKDTRGAAALRLRVPVAGFSSLDDLLRGAIRKYQGSQGARRNPPEGAVTICPRILSIEYSHPDGKGRPYRHDFKSKTPILGLPNGSLMIPSRGRPLWGAV